MNLYAESSAVLAWLLGQSAGRSVQRLLAGAENVAASRLTLVECHRTLIRAARQGLLTDAQTSDEVVKMARASAHWGVLQMSEPILERAERPFPSEPLRTLDAIHLASALDARTALPNLALLSLDERIRENARRLGFEVLPDE